MARYNLRGKGKAAVKPVGIPVIEPTRIWTIEDKYDALLEYVQYKKLKLVLKDPNRKFVMPSQILSTAAQRTVGQELTLEDFPTEIMLNIMSSLTGAELIMLSLTSKHMANVVEACPKARPAIIAPLGEYERQGWLSRTFPQIIPDLRFLVGNWMGRNNHLYCNECEKFRPTDEDFWYGFFDHAWRAGKMRDKFLARINFFFLLTESGSIVNDPRTEQQKRIAKQQELTENRRKTIEKYLERWPNIGAGWSGVEHVVKRSCPAHLFSRGRTGFTKTLSE